VAPAAPAEALEPPPEPHAVQREALVRLRACRAEGRTRAIVVLATGLGETWLAAFDHAQLHAELGAGGGPCGICPWYPYVTGGGPCGICPWYPYVTGGSPCGICPWYPCVTGGGPCGTCPWYP
jgi:hypothetical protein